MNRKCVIVLGVLAALGTGAWAEDSPRDLTSPVAVARLNWIKIRGRVSSISPDQKLLAISDPDGNITHVAVDENVMILRSCRVVNFEALKPKDRVELRYVRAGM